MRQLSLIAISRQRSTTIISHHDPALLIFSFEGGPFFSSAHLLLCDLTEMNRRSILINERKFHSSKKDSGMPRTPEANQRIREAQRAKILESARSVFARKGMEATIADIAAEAQISLGLAYRYFADKEAIFSELVKQTVPDDSAGFQKLVEMPGTPGERLATLISSIVGARGQREPLEAHQLLQHALDADAMPEEIRELLGKRYQMLLATMRQLIVEGQAEGSVAPGNPDQLVAVMSACLDGLTRWALRDPEQFRASVPDAQIVLRLFQPSTEEKKASEQS
jgi:AcrR family transcriptional regulator